MKSATKRTGFTLVEMVVAVAIVAALAAIAIPAYQQYVFRARRVDGQNALNFVAQGQEKFFATYNRYTTDLTSAPPAGLGLSGCESGSSATDCNYQISVALLNGDQNFIASGAPINKQAGDVCGTLSLSGLGAKLPGRNDALRNKNGPCW